MLHTTLKFNPRLARLVVADTLVPHQHKTPPRFKIASDFRQQVMIKHPFLSDFHSRAEHLYAGLLEGDPTVSSYVPQPLMVRIRNRRYTPDGYVVADNAPRRIIELKPRGEMADDLCIPLQHFFAQHGFQFEVISNESVYEREIEAENWLEIVRMLHVARNLMTTQQEEIVLDRLIGKSVCQLGDLIDPGSREETYLIEIAVFRLLHQGHIKGLLSESYLDFDTGVALCA